MGSRASGCRFPAKQSPILAGIYSGTGHDLNIVSVITTAATSAIAGQIIGFVIGREFGYRLLLRFGPYSGSQKAASELGEYLFLRHGSKIIVIARFVPLLGSLAGILAGADRMPWPQFLLSNIVGAFAWASVFGFAAYMLGHQVEHVAGPLVIVIGIAALVALAIGANFVGRHEAQLVAEAERALPGRLK